MDAALTANQRYKIYKRNGGELNFTGWLNTIGGLGFGLDYIENDVQQTFNTKPVTNPLNSNVMMHKTVLGIPVKTLVIGAAVVGAGLLVYHLMKKK